MADNLAPARASILTAYTEATANLATVLASIQPSYSIGGQSVSRAEYATMLQGQIDALWKQLIAVSGPYSGSTRGKS